MSKNTINKIEKNEYVFELNNISKSFLNGAIKANSNVTFAAKKGEVIGLVGENGAGKSTLMSILFGLYQPDQGDILVNGKKVKITSPTVANKFGIGMVPQHFKLVGNMTVIENVMLGVEVTKYGILDRKAIEAKIRQYSKEYGLHIDPWAKIDSLSIGMKQRVEIIKMLFKESNIMVFDEPTSVLTPQESDQLLDIIRTFQKNGKTIIFISHKLKEILAISDYVVVMRKGAVTGHTAAKTATPAKLSEMMVGETVELKFDKKPTKLEVEDREKLLVDFHNVSVKEGTRYRLKDASFTVKAGEVVGLVGVDGNGQSEVIRLIAGLIKPTSGTVKVNIMSDKEKQVMAEIEKLNVELELLHSNPKEYMKKYIKEWKDGDLKEESHIIQDKITELSQKITKLKSSRKADFMLYNGLGHIAEDRQRDAVALDMSIPENMTFNRINDFSKLGLLNKAKINKFSENIITKYDVRGADDKTAIMRGLSGGNQQKAVTGREIENASKLLLAAHPTRGVDIGAIKNIYKHILECAHKGAGVVLLSGELDELLAVADKLVVFAHGEITGIVKPNEVTRSQIGLMMTGTKKDELFTTSKKSTATKTVKVVKQTTTAKKATVAKKTVAKSTTKKPVVKKAATKKQPIKKGGRK